MLYCRDAKDIFLPKESVDLFVTHPPYESSKTVDLYGNFEFQIHNGTKDEYLRNLVDIVKHMEYALKPDGRILLGVPARPIFYEVVAVLLKEINLNFEAPVVWEFGKDKMYDGYYDTQVYFINMTKGFPYIGKIDSLVIDIPWRLSVELNGYEGFTNDSVPLDFCDTIVESFSKEGDTVADLMAGTASILLSAKNKNRNIVYNDVSEEQFNIAKKRLLEGK
jgi:DNA modification methylase